MSTVLKSTLHNIVIELTGWDEPTNGRMLHTANLLINGQIANATYFDDWNRLNEQLDRVTIDSIDGKFVYIPAESGGFLIDTITLKKVSQPYKDLSTVKFIGNSFFNETLIVVYTDEIVLFNTTSGKPVHVNFNKGVISWAEVAEDGYLVITYTDQLTKRQLTDRFRINVA
ncbi:hypothetical protein ACVWYN_002204 [Pedobacter sp. UYP24]